MRIAVPDPDLRQALDTIVRHVTRAGGRALVVGGTVRDALLDLPAEDLDLEVYGLAPETLRSLLDTHFDIDLVGQSFGVIKLRGIPLDVSLPRRESKRGLGHKGFEVYSDPEMTVHEAARRRDFTINAMAWDPASEELVDPYAGAADLEKRMLRHVSEAFSEDPLRVLRGMQFTARFDLTPAAETIDLCRRIEPEGLAQERIFDEWSKLVLSGRAIGKGLDFLRATGWLRYTPELEALVDCPQEPEWHPEGDVWTHTCHVMDAFALERLDDRWEDLVVGFACLCHDLGKPATTFTDENGRIRSPDHEAQGEAPTRDLLGRLTRQSQLIDEVVPLVREHLKPIQLFKANASAAAVRRLARRVGRIDRLVRVCRADHRGRPPLPWDDFPAGAWLLDRAAELELAKQAPKPLIQGRHLIALGLRPGPHFGPLLETVFDAQLDGLFADIEHGLMHTREVIAAWRHRQPPGDS